MTPERIAELRAASLHEKAELENLSVDGDQMGLQPLPVSVWPDELLALLAECERVSELQQLTDAMRDSTVKPLCPASNRGTYGILIDLGDDPAPASIAYRILGAMALSPPQQDDTQRSS